MWTKKFWVAALERGLKSSAQALIGLWGLNQFDVLEADWKLALSAAAGGFLLSMLTSIVSEPVGESGPQLFGK